MYLNDISDQNAALVNREPLLTIPFLFLRHLTSAGKIQTSDSGHNLSNFAMPECWPWRDMHHAMMIAAVFLYTLR